MITIARLLLIAGLATTLSLTACEDSGGGTGTTTDGHEHAEGDGHDHDEPSHEGQSHAGEEHTEDVHAGQDHEDQVMLGTVNIGDIEVQAYQGHGVAAPGKELHLLVKIGEGDARGATVRGWIGTNDRYQSVVALAEYSSAEGGYELHAVAPDPLPADATWWIEVQLADGTTHVGSVPIK